MRNWLKKKLVNLLHEAPEAPTVARDVLDGCELAIVAYKIDNGYLLRMNNGGMGMRVSLVYCADEKEIAEKVVAHRAKNAIFKDPDPRYGVSAVKGFHVSPLGCGETVSLRVSGAILSDN